MHLNFQKIGKDLKSWHPVSRNGWWIKFSISNGNILIFFTSSFTGQTVVRFFSHEDSAVKFINYIVNQNPEEELMDY